MTAISSSFIVGLSARRIRSFAKSGDVETIAQNSALILASQFGALFDYGTLLLSFFYFKMGANELVTSYFGLRAPIANFLVKAAQGVEDWLDVRVGELQMTLQNSSPALVVGMCVCSENE